LYRGWWKPKKKRHWSKTEAIATIFIAILAGAAIVAASYAANQSNNVSQQLLNIEKRQFAFTTSVYPYSSSATVYAQYYDYTTNSSINSVNAISLSRISPFMRSILCSFGLWSWCVLCLGLNVCFSLWASLF